MKVHCVLPVGGLFFLGLGHGKDAVVWNAMRRYGEVRLPLLLHGWRTAGTVAWEERRLTADAPLRGKSYEPVWLLKPDAAAAADCEAVRRVHCDEAALPLEALDAEAAADTEPPPPPPPPPPPQQQQQ